MMFDWNTYRNQVAEAVSGISKLSPDTVRGYSLLGSAGAKTGHRDAKTRELISLAVGGGAGLLRPRDGRVYSADWQPR